MRMELFKVISEILKILAHQLDFIHNKTRELTFENLCRPSSDETCWTTHAWFSQYGTCFWDDII